MLKHANDEKAIFLENRPVSPRRQAEVSPARPAPGAQSARRGTCTGILSQTGS